MKPRDGVAVTEPAIAAALGPPDDRKPAHSLLLQPGAHFTRGKSHVALGPLPRPEILGAIKTGGADPVGKREVVRVFDSKPALLGRIDHEQPTERPERLAAQVLFGFLFDHDHSLAGVGNLRRGNQAGEAGADDDHVCFCVHGANPKESQSARTADVGGSRAA
jgi:hypothetical protein